MFQMLIEQADAQNRTTQQLVALEQQVSEY